MAGEAPEGFEGFAEGVPPRAADPNFLHGFHFDDQKDDQKEETTELDVVFDKWFKVGDGGMEFHGYEAGEIISILAKISEFTPGDSASWRAGS